MTDFNPYQAQIQELERQIKKNQALLSDGEMKDLAQQEIAKLETEKQTLEKAAKEFEESMSSSEKDISSTTKSKAIIEIRAGAGGDEAKIWANDLHRMYMRFCENKNLKVEYLDDLVIKVSGKTEIEIKKLETEKAEKGNVEPIKNETETSEPAGPQTIYPYELFKFETGVHRVQRVPATESQGRIHTSTASVAVLPEIHEKAVEIREEDLDWQFMRASGAGGQSVNKTSSAVRLTHVPTGIVVVSRSERKQAQNRQIALNLLRSRLWEIEEEKKLAKIGEARSAIGRNMRAEKIRTYNFPQNRVTDHRIHHSWHNLEIILDGELEEVISIVKGELEN